jgi:hypothetical protein
LHPLLLSGLNGVFLIDSPDVFVVALGYLLFYVLILVLAIYVAVLLTRPVERVRWCC